MMRLLPALAALLLAAAPALAEPFEIGEDDHTPNEAVFTSTAPLVKFRGRTSNIKGNADILLDRISASRGEFDVDLASLETGMKFRDKHMRSVLETDKFPAAHFKILGIKSAAVKVIANTPLPLAIDGEITIHGITKSVTMPSEIVYFAEDPKVREGRWAQLTSTFKIRLTDFGIKLSPTTLGPKVNNDVTIEITAMAKATGIAQKQ